MTLKSTGIVRRVDDLGRVFIPIDLRRAYEIDFGDPLEIFTTDQGIVLRKYQPGCTFCGNTQIAKVFKVKPVCGDCIAEIGR